MDFETITPESSVTTEEKEKEIENNPGHLWDSYSPISS